MNILWLTWKDYTHPLAGGAEVVLRELSKRLVADGHKVTYLTARYPGAAPQETLDGIEMIRIGGNRYLHSLQAFLYYLRRLRGKYDVVVEVVNTAPYFGVLFKGRSKAFLFYHQLAREVWFHETKPPLAQLGYHALEPLATRALARSRTPLITISHSTLQDLGTYGFKPEKAHIITQGIELEPLPTLRGVHKFAEPTVLSLGAMRAMKRTLDQVKAFEFAKAQLPELKMILAGDAAGDYGQTVLDYIARSPFAADISYEGRVSRERKIELMRRCHIMCVTSVKEGWGLIVTEAASQGTPAVVYNVDGLRDSVQNLETGLVVPPYALALAGGIVQLVRDQALYQKVRSNAWQWSKNLTFDQSYKDFKQLLEA
ncbi:MAG TPA: glycosyltransferase family 4 protein [Candidatus Saccharimonadales bacterium]|nr:glycosyltransferase family 4 protein [Candidatus Saccharimonadales bacterium]